MNMARTNFDEQGCGCQLQNTQSSMLMGAMEPSHSQSHAKQGLSAVGIHARLEEQITPLHDAAVCFNGMSCDTIVMVNLIESSAMFLRTKLALEPLQSFMQPLKSNWGGYDAR